MPGRSLLSTMMLVGCLASVAAAGQTPATSEPRPRDLTFDPGSAAAAATPARATIPRGYAVVIGIATYPKLDTASQLQFPESDAQAFYRVLIDRNAGAFPAENVRLLLGRQATLANIRQAVESWLPSVAQPTDRVVVFFAGHGFVAGGRGYLAGSDVDPARLEETAYAMSSLGDVLSHKVKGRWKVLLTDACHSGKITTETTNESMDQQFTHLPADFLTLTATTEREQSYEDAALSTGFGLFTYFLAQGWHGNADNDPCDGRVTADELVEYVRVNVRRYAKDRQLTQTPTARGDYDPEMLLGVSPSCLGQKPAESASMLGTAIVEVNLDEVDVFIDGTLVGRVGRGKPIALPRLSAGIHEFMGVKQGYEPDRKSIMVAPGQEVTVTLRIRYPLRVKPSALRLGQDGERLLFTHRSTINPLNVVPTARSQSQADLRRARDLFTRALAEDPGYATAAFNLGQANQLLGDEDESLAAYRRAIAIDPGYVDARIQYAAVLIESGDTDEAIRQLTDALRLSGDTDELHAMLARAYWDKGAWTQAIESATKAIRLNPSNAQAYLWQADALRQLAAADSDRERRAQRYRDAREGYRRFVSLTNLSSSVMERLAFHFVGFGIGSRRHPDRQDAYERLRNAGYLGLCVTEQKVGNLQRAREYCLRALRYEEKSPITLFLLGNINRDLYNQYPSCEYLTAAHRAYQSMLALNPDLDEARFARNYVGQIDRLRVTQRCAGD